MNMRKALHVALFTKFALTFGIISFVNTQVVLTPYGIAMCNLKCQQTTGCHRFAYKEEYLICCFKVYSQIPSSCSDGSFRIIVLRTKIKECDSGILGGNDTSCKTAVNKIGSSCGADLDCDADNSVCNDGQCKCDIGYSFSPKGPVVCTTNCSVYGSSFFRFDTKTVFMNNDETHNSVTEAQCKQLCVERDWCKSFEFEKSTSICNLMNKSWLEYAVFSRNTNSDWAFSTRNCLE